LRDIEIAKADDRAEKWGCE